MLAAPPIRRPLQTWEYAPSLLRSWAYVLPYAAISRIVDNSFLAVRLCAVALPFALAEASLVNGMKARFGPDAGWILLGLLLSSAGHAAAAPALVPSATICALAAWSQSRWLRGDRRGAVLIAVLATLWPGWPFVGVLFVPLAVDVVVKDGLREALLLGVASGVVIGLPCAAFDIKAYGRATSPLWNVITYNAVGGGDELYGVAPWTYYAKNLGLNAGIALVLVLTLPMTLFLQHVLARDPRRTASTVLTHAAPFVLWVGILLLRPHKEERFLFPAFPSLYVGAAAARGASQWARSAHRGRETGYSLTYVALGAAANPAHEVAPSTTTTPDDGVARGGGDGGKRPGDGALQQCTLPGTLLLPSNARLGFVRLRFDGQLPRPHVRRGPARATPRCAVGFNGRNGGEDNETWPRTGEPPSTCASTGARRWGKYTDVDAGARVAVPRFKQDAALARARGRLLGNGRNSRRRTSRLASADLPCFARAHDQYLQNYIAARARRPSAPRPIIARCRPPQPHSAVFNTAGVVPVDAGQRPPQAGSTSTPLVRKSDTRTAAASETKCINALRCHCPNSGDGVPAGASAMKGVIVAGFPPPIRQ